MSKHVPVTILSAALLSGALLAGCGGSDTPAASSDTGAGVTRTYTKPPPMAIDPSLTTLNNEPPASLR